MSWRERFGPWNRLKFRIVTQCDVRDYAFVVGIISVSGCNKNRRREREMQAVGDGLSRVGRQAYFLLVVYAPGCWSCTWFDLDTIIDRTFTDLRSRVVLWLIAWEAEDSNRARYSRLIAARWDTFFTDLTFYSRTFFHRLNCFYRGTILRKLVVFPIRWMKMSLVIQSDLCTIHTLKHTHFNI
jgi:hypothetical protein